LAFASAFESAFGAESFGAAVVMVRIRGVGSDEKKSGIARHA